MVEATVIGLRMMGSTLARLLLRNGYRVTLNYRSQPNIGNAVLDVTVGRGVDVVVETVGASTLKHSLAAIRLRVM